MHAAFSRAILLAVLSTQLSYAQEGEQEECIADAMDVGDELSALQTNAEALRVKVKNSPANLPGVFDGTQNRTVSLLSSVKEQGIKQNILKVFIQNEKANAEMCIDPGTTIPYCKATYFNRGKSLFRILEPRDGYFDIRKNIKGTGKSYLFDSRIPYMKTGRPASSQWQFTGVSRRGTLKMMGRSGKLLKTKRDGTTLREIDGTVCGKACSYNVIIFMIRWDSIPHDSFPVDYSDPWAASSLLQQSQNLSRIEHKMTTTSPNGYTAAITSIGWYGTVNRYNSFNLASNSGSYAIDQTKFGTSSTQFKIWDAGVGDDVFLLQDTAGLYLTCAPGQDALVGSASPTVYSTWKMWRCLEHSGNVAFQCIKKGMYFLNNYDDGIAKASAISCDDSDYKKSYFGFNLRLTGFASRR
jgi:hypothetical protein